MHFKQRGLPAKSNERARAASKLLAAATDSLPAQSSASTLARWVRASAATPCPPHFTLLGVHHRQTMSAILRLIRAFLIEIMCCFRCAFCYAANSIYR